MRWINLVTNRPQDFMSSLDASNRCSTELFRQSVSPSSVDFGMNSSARTPKTFPFSVWYTCGDDSNHAAFPIGDSAEFVCFLYFNQLFFRMTDTVMHLRLQAMIFHCPSMGGVPCISRAKSCQKIFLERWLPTLCYPGCNQQVCDLK